MRQPAIAARPRVTPRAAVDVEQHVVVCVVVQVGQVVHGLLDLAAQRQPVPQTSRLLKEGHGHLVAAQRLGELHRPVSQGVALGDLVGHVDQRQAQAVGQVGVVVLDVAGHQRAHAGRRGPVDQRGARTGHHGDALDHPRGVAGEVDGRHAEQRADLSGELLERARPAQVADAPQARRPHLVVDRIDVERRFFVGVGRDEGVGDGSPQRPREHRFEAQLARALLDPHLTDTGVGALAGSERALSRCGKRAMDVVADGARAGGEDRRAHRVEVALGHEADQLGPVHASRCERRDALQVEGAADDVGETAVGLVDVGVGRDDGDALARGVQDEAAGVGVGRDRRERLAQQWMMDQQRLAVAPRRMVDGRSRGIEGDQHGPYRSLRIADLQTHAVPRLGELEGSDPIDCVKDCCELHGPSLPPPDRARPAARSRRSRRGAAAGGRRRRSGSDPARRRPEGSRARPRLPRT